MWKEGRKDGTILMDLLSIGNSAKTDLGNVILPMDYSNAECGRCPSSSIRLRSYGNGLYIPPSNTADVYGRTVAHAITTADQNRIEEEETKRNKSWTFSQAILARNEYIDSWTATNLRRKDVCQSEN